MRLVLISAMLLINNFLFSQTWQTIDSDGFSPINIFTGGSGGTIGTKWFKINPYDNSLWMGWSDKIQVLRNDGTIEMFDYTTDPILHQNGNMLEFEFTSDYNYMVDEHYGLYKYDGINWSSVYLLDGGLTLSSDEDTIWMATSNNTNYIYSYDGFAFTGDLSPRRIQSRNGNMWISSTHNSDIARVENGSYFLYSPDTSMLLDWTNYDFKFSKTDTLYVAGSKGFSLAYNETFIDTITPGNSTNMPSASVIEFEFDNDNNIWAVFGDASFIPNAIGYYNHTTETWSQIYDANNSPIDFSNRISIEVDTAGNLWVTDGDFLHILKINNPPAWLGIENNIEENKISIYPNPVKNELKISGVDNIIELEILDLKGEVILEYSNTKNIFLDHLSSGLYILRMTTDTGKVGQNKFIKE